MPSNGGKSSAVSVYYYHNESFKRGLYICAIAYICAVARSDGLRFKSSPVSIPSNSGKSLAVSVYYYHNESFKSATDICAKKCKKI